MMGFPRTSVFSFLVAAVVSAAIGLFCVAKLLPRRLQEAVNEPVPKFAPAVSGREIFATLGDTDSNDSDARLAMLEKLSAVPDEAIPALVAAAFAAASGGNALDFPTRAGLVRWAEFDASAAFAWLARLENKVLRSAGYDEIGMIWAHEDSAAYAVWLGGEVGVRPIPLNEGGFHHEGGFYHPDEHIRIALDYLARYDLPSAMRIVFDGNRTHDFESSIGMLSTAEECREVAKVIGENESVPKVTRGGGGIDGANRSFSFTGSADTSRGPLATRWQQIDSDDYRKAIESGEFDPGFRGSGYGGDFELEKSISELGQMVDESVRREEIFSIVESWAVEDLEAAGKWLGSLGDVEETWPARRCFARMAAREDPGAALVWLETIGDERMRRAGLVDVVESWVREHPDANPDMSGWSQQRRRAWEELSAVVWMRDE